MWRYPGVPQLILPPDCSKETGTMSSPRSSWLFSLSIRKHFIWKPRSPFPFSQPVGWWKHGSWAYRCLYLTAEKVVARESWRFSCVPRSVGGEAFGGHHWLCSAVRSTWRRKDAGAPREQYNPPTSLKCAYPQCYHQARPQNSVRAKSTLSKKKKGTNKLSFCHPPPLCAAEENQMK